jgi:exopolysaccharide biosynthesis polyprenyl glycosylphosphotransferase
MLGGNSTAWSSTEDQRAISSIVASSSRGSVPIEQRALGPSQVKLRLVTADVLAVMIGVGLAFAVQYAVKPVPDRTAVVHLTLIVASLPGFATGAMINRLYQARANERLGQEFRNVAWATATGIGVLLALAFVFQYRGLSRLWVSLVAVGVLVSVATERRLARIAFRKMRLDGRLTRRILIIGTDPHAIGLLHTYERNPALGYEVVGFVGDDELGERCGVGVLGRVADIPRILAEQDVCGVVISPSSVGHDEVNLLTRRLTDAGYHVALSPSLTDIDVTRLRPQQLDGRNLLYVEPVIRSGWRAAAKRVFDVTTASSILLVTSPLLVAAAIAIKLDSPGPVFFRQVRVGQHGVLFTITKLRTMVIDAEERKSELADQNEADGPLFKIERDPRVTRVGRILRKVSLDEAPQLLSVIRGTMSMVGPRPALPEEVAKWDQALLDRLRVPPGVTGMWQVSGRSDTSFEQYRRLDLYYVDNWSLTHDLRICAKTVGVVLTGKGAS